MDLKIQKHLMSKFRSLPFNFFDGYEETEMPYGRFGYTHVLDTQNKSNDSQSITIQIDLFSAYNGQKEIKEMIQKIKELTKDSFIIENTTIHRNALSTQILEEIDDEQRIYHGVVELTLVYY